jgi:hypothetical protein
MTILSRLFHRGRHLDYGHRHAQYAAIRMNDNVNAFTNAGQGLIDRVIDNFIDQVVQRFDIRAAHIHTRATTDGFQAFQYLNIFCLIAGIRLNHNFLRINSNKN